MCAKRQLERRLLAPAYGYSEQQIRNIGAGDQEHQQHQSHQNTEDQLGGRYRIRREQRGASDNGCAVLVVLWIRGSQLRGERRHFTLRLTPCDSGFEARHQGEPPHVALLEPRVALITRGSQRSEQVRIESIERSCELLRRNADNRRVDDLLADDIRIRALSFPVRISHHRDRRPGVVVTGRKEPAKVGMDSQYRKIIVRDRGFGDVHLMDFIKVSGKADRNGPGRHVHKDVVVRPVIHVVRIRDLPDILSRRAGINHHQAIRIGCRRRCKDESIRNAERQHAQRHRNRE